MKRVQQGFTLIELMIVVAIVGILAAIALPAYQDYIVRSKMSETEAAIAACKTSVAEYAATKNSMPGTAAEAGCSSVGSQYVSAGGGWGGAAITYSSTNTGASGGECTLTLTPQAMVSGGIPGWTGSYTVCQAKYVPAAFR
jgi:type IV pilus assembly protein PilA